MRWSKGPEFGAHGTLRKLYFLFLLLAFLLCLNIESNAFASNLERTLHDSVLIAASGGPEAVTCYVTIMLIILLLILIF